MDVYNSFLDVPLDDPPEWEGDDSIPVNARPDVQARYLTGLSPTPGLVVPFKPCEPGVVGDRVYAMKRAHARYRGAGRLAALMSKPRRVRRTWSFYTGPGGFTREFKETQRRLGVVVTGRYDKATHERLAPWYDAYALALLKPDPRNERINKQIAWHMEFYNQRYRIAYSQARPSQLGRVPQITRADCSGSVAGGCHWAGILPNVDWRWTNTWAQIHFGQGVSVVRDALPGDVFLYGQNGDPSHEALYLGSGRVWSFGSYPARILQHDYRGDLIAIRRFLP